MCEKSFQRNKAVKDLLLTFTALFLYILLCFISKIVSSIFVCVLLTSSRIPFKSLIYTFKRLSATLLWISYLTPLDSISATTIAESISFIISFSSDIISYILFIIHHYSYTNAFERLSSGLNLS